MARAVTSTRTPLQFNSYLSDAIGLETWIKREDLQDEIGSGVKRRAVAATISHCRSIGCETIVTDGVPQSNCVRAFAHYCQQEGLEFHVVYRGRLPEPPIGNYAAVVNTNAIVHNAACIDQFPEALNSVLQHVRRRRREPLVVPAGAAAPYALLGPIGLAVELSAQIREMGLRPDYLALPVGTGGTIIGLAIGKLLQDEAWNIVGIRIDEYPRSRYGRIYRDARSYFDLGELEAHEGRESIPFAFHESSIGAGYGLFDANDLKDSTEFYVKTGLYFGPTYMWKCFRGIKQLSDSGNLAIGSQLILIHTGGTGEKAMALREI